MNDSALPPDDSHRDDSHRDDAAPDIPADAQDRYNDDLPSDHRSGVVAVVGRPNAGKSTLINGVLGEKIAIVTPKPQTTRRQQLGILTQDRGQILLIDTPGIHTPQHRLGETMNTAAESSFHDTDAILLLFDISGDPDHPDTLLSQTVTRLRGDQPVILALNKIDRLPPTQHADRIAAFCALLPHDTAFAISALTGEGVPALIDHLFGLMPLGPRYYPPDQLSEVNLRFLAAETIREQVMLLTEDEIPYSTAVEIDSYRERSDSMTYIAATIYVERDTQKGIVVGKRGERIKEIGSSARRALESQLGTRVYLELFVKVLKDWRKDDRQLNRFGYRTPKKK